MAAITMKKIASEAKVSRPTVSAVLNGRAESARISEKTTRKIIETAKRLGYRRNEIARAMVTGRSNFIGFVGDLSYEYASLVMKGAVERADALGYFVKVFTQRKGGEFESFLHRMIEQRPAGIIFRTLLAEEHDIVLKECLSHDIPFSIAGSSFHGCRGIRVLTDDEHGAKIAVDRLVALGHADIAHFSGKRGNGYVELRRSGFLKAMEAHGLSPRDEFIFHDDPLERLEIAACELFSSEDRPTAVFCASDYIAMVLLRAIRKVGLSVPEDVSVIGYSGMLAAELSDPPLTTISEPFVEMGNFASEMLIEEILGSERRSLDRRIDVVLDVSLKEGKSTAPVSTNKDMI